MATNGELSTGGVATLRTFLASIDWFGFLAEVVLESMVVCLMRIGEALPTKLPPKKPYRDDIKFVIPAKMAFRHHW